MSIKKLFGKHGPISQPDGFAGIDPNGTYWSEPTQDPESTIDSGGPRLPKGIHTVALNRLSRKILHAGCSGPCCIPELYQPGMQKGGPIGLRFPVGQLQGGVNNTQPYQPAELYTRPEIQQALDSMIRNFEGVVRFLQERIQYVELKNDAYRKVWSAREYLEMLNHHRFNISQNEGYAAAYRVLTNALRELDLERRVDESAIRAKYEETK